MDSKSTALLMKIVALFDSPNDGERDNAFAKARELLKKQGQSMAGLAEVLTALGVRASAIADFREWAGDREPNSLPRDRENPLWTAGRPGETESRADIIARYGSIQNALRPCERENSLRAGVRRVSTFHGPPNERWTRSVYGYSPDQPGGVARDRALRMLARACPLPANIQDALTEHVYWQQRDRELRLIAGRGLDLSADLRWDVIRDLIRSVLPVRGTAEFQLRMQFWIDERQEELGWTTPGEVARIAEMVGRDLSSAIALSGRSPAVLFAQWVCDLVVPALRLPDHGHTGSPATFDAMLRDAMRAALTEGEAPRPVE